MLNSKRHKTASKSFEEMTFREQNYALNHNALQFRRQLAIHLRAAKAHGHSPKDVLNVRVRLLKRLFDRHAKEIETTAVSV